MEQTAQSALLTRPEAAAYLGVTVATLEAWASRSFGPTYIKVGRLVKYRQHDLERFLSSREVTSTGDGNQAVFARIVETSITSGECTCSFCRVVTNKTAKVFIAGLDAYICNVCVDMAAKLVADSSKGTRP